MLGLSGLYAPIATPFTDDGEAVSEVRMARLARHLLDRGVDGFVTGAESGEFMTMTSSERKHVLEILGREVGAARILAHCTRLGTIKTLALCQHAAWVGARAAVVMPPYYGTYSDKEIENHIRRVSQHAELPVILIDPHHQVRHEARQALEGLPDLIYAETLEARFRTRFAVEPSGAASDEFVVDDMVVSPLIQIDPVGARDEEVDLDDLARMVALHGRPRMAKAALNLRDVEVGPPRPPVLPLGFEDGEKLRSLIRTL